MTEATPNQPVEQDPHAPHHGLMEELNLPPKIISFVRENAKNLKLGGITLAVVVLAVLGFDSYKETQKEKSNTMLYRVMQGTDDTERTGKLTELIEAYPGTSAALWGQVELAQNARQNGNTDEALAGFEKVYSQLDKKSPLAPLTLLAMAELNESKGDLEKAVSLYEKLAAIDGFIFSGKRGQARVLEQQQQWDAAGAVYEGMLADEDLSEGRNAWIDAKLVALAERIVTP